MSLFTFKGKMLGQMTDDDFSQLCADNPDLRLERDADGTILVDMPNHSHTGEKNAEILLEVGLWNRKTKLGKVYDSCAGFTLPNTATLSLPK